MGDTLELPMFPLGSVLFPGMPLALRVFEPRYLELLGAVLDHEPPEFGVVLIERGQEVGGGDVRFAVGTVARIVQLDAGREVIGLLARGTRRVEVVRWLGDDPFPRAEVRELPALTLDAGSSDLLGDVERTVRETLRLADLSGQASWDPDTELGEDPAERIWQLAGIAPLGDLDRQELLGSATARALLETLAARTSEARDYLG